jgi:hypothetical protein
VEIQPLDHHLSSQEQAVAVVVDIMDLSIPLDNLVDLVVVMVLNHNNLVLEMREETIQDLLQLRRDLMEVILRQTATELVVAEQHKQGKALGYLLGGIGAPVPTAIAPASTGTPGPSPGRYFAGGGGGSGAQPGSGGSGGGGAGGSTSAGSPGTTNTGGGGGGAQAPMGTLTGGDGGTGIVIVSYEA